MTEVSTTTPPPAPPPPAPPKDRTWVMLCHGSAFAGIVFSQLGGVLGPLVVWLLKRDQDPEVREHGKEALNFNLSFLIWQTVAGLLVFVLVGIVLFPVVWVTWMVLAVLGTVRASEGTLYRYPFTIRFID